MTQHLNKMKSEYSKWLLDIKRKWAFRSITPEEISTYKFEATIKEEKEEEDVNCYAAQKKTKQYRGLSNRSKT